MNYDFFSEELMLHKKSGANLQPLLNTVNEFIRYYSSLSNYLTKNYSEVQYLFDKDIDSYLKNNNLLAFEDSCKEYFMYRNTTILDIGEDQILVKVESVECDGPTYDIKTSINEDILTYFSQNNTLKGYQNELDDIFLKYKKYYKHLESLTDFIDSYHEILIKLNEGLSDIHKLFIDEFTEICKNMDITFKSKTDNTYFDISIHNCSFNDNYIVYDTDDIMVSIPKSLASKGNLLSKNIDYNNLYDKCKLYYYNAREFDTVMVKLIKKIEKFGEYSIGNVDIVLSEKEFYTNEMSEHEIYNNILKHISIVDLPILSSLSEYCNYKDNINIFIQFENRLLKCDFFSYGSQNGFDKWVEIKRNILSSKDIVKKPISNMMEVWNHIVKKYLSENTLPIFNDKGEFNEYMKSNK